ncbi:hypothetical protein AK830_g613 [Neonectria ditissima]|uniref:Uncharacterized protein n=1 Tax=Neonectria ditissima TaxID=78410 RepID=A0A0P7BKY7_9HYPO|nr:hypothetical protein AK830_g613 [Neonectria ditissima]
MRPATTPLRLRALRPQRLTTGPSSALLRRHAQPAAIAGWQSPVRAMSTVVDYPGRPSQPPPVPTATNESVEKQRSERAKRILREAVSAAQPRHDWTKEEIG